MGYEVADLSIMKIFDKRLRDVTPERLEGTKYNCREPTYISVPSVRTSINHGEIKRIA